MDIVSSALQMSDPHPVDHAVKLAPPRGLAWAQVATSVVVLALSSVADPAGRFLLVPAALVVLALGLRDALQRPVLRASDDGLEVVSGRHRVRCPWADVEQVRVLRDRRTPLLEIDLAGTLVVLSGRRLGVPPAQALAALAPWLPPPG